MLKPSILLVLLQFLLIVNVGVLELQVKLKLLQTLLLMLMPTNLLLLHQLLPQVNSTCLLLVPHLNH